MSDKLFFFFFPRELLYFKTATEPLPVDEANKLPSLRNINENVVML